MSGQIEKYKPIIAGEKVDASSGETMDIVNPATGAGLAKLETAEQIG